MSVRMVRLGDVCTRISDGTHQAPNWADNGVPFLFVSNIRDGRISFETNKFVSKEEYTTLTKNCPIDAGDVLYTAVGSYGNSAVVPSGRTFIFQRHIAHLKPQRELVDSTYLAQMLETPAVRRQADKLARGVAQKTVTLGSLRHFEIPLPPLDEQKRIAAILDKADALRAKRRQAIALLDSLTQSIFLEMFGADVFSPHGITLGEIGEIQIGPFGSLLHKEDYSEDGIPLVNPMHIVDGVIAPSPDMAVSTVKYPELSRYHLRIGDVVLGRRGEMGRCAVIGREESGYVCGTGSMFIRPHADKLNSVFLAAFLRSNVVVKHLESAAAGVTMPNLNKTVVANISLNLPKYDQQLRFDRAVNAITRTAKNSFRSSVATSSLFASLQHRAFTGQL